MLVCSIADALINRTEHKARRRIPAVRGEPDLGIKDHIAVTSEVLHPGEAVGLFQGQRQGVVQYVALHIGIIGIF